MVHITVTIDARHASTVSDVAEALRAAGMQVEQVLDAIGMVTGTIEEDAEQSVRTVAGVQSVDRALGFQLPPPDAPVQ
jgi:hypothetical protein